MKARMSLLLDLLVFALFVGPVVLAALFPELILQLLERALW